MGHPRRELAAAAAAAALFLPVSLPLMRRAEPFTILWVLLALAERQAGLEPPAAIRGSIGTAPRNQAQTPRPDRPPLESLLRAAQSQLEPISRLAVSVALRLLDLARLSFRVELGERPATQPQPTLDLAAVADLLRQFGAMAIPPETAAQPALHLAEMELDLAALRLLHSAVPDQVCCNQLEDSPPLGFLLLPESLGVVAVVERQMVSPAVMAETALSIFFLQGRASALAAEAAALEMERPGRAERAACMELVAPVEAVPQRRAMVVTERAVASSFITQRHSERP